MPRQNLPSRFGEDVFSGPFFRSLQKEIDDVFSRFRTPGMTRIPELDTDGEIQLMPALDIAESDDSLEITAEIPGVKEEDLDVTITGDVLSLKGEKSSEKEEKDKNYQLVERRFGSFHRRIPLGFTPDEGMVDATFKDGVLSLKIAKPSEVVSKTHKVAIGKS